MGHGWKTPKDASVFGAFLQVCRQQRGLTQLEVAAHAGIHLLSYERLEAGSHAVSLTESQINGLSRILDTRDRKILALMRGHSDDGGSTRRRK